MLGLTRSEFLDSLLQATLYQCLLTALQVFAETIGI